MTLDLTKKRNVALVGQGGSGKTTFAEAIFYSLGLTTRLGRVEDGNTISDHTPEEIRRRHSISTSILPFSYRDIQITLLDCPGYIDFIGEVVSALSAVESALIFINASGGIEGQAYHAWEIARAKGLATCIVVNQVDREDIDFKTIASQIQENFGKGCIPLFIPCGTGGRLTGVVDLLGRKLLKTESQKTVVTEIPEEISSLAEEFRFPLIESIVERDESLFEKYLSEEPLEEAELKKVLRNSIVAGDISPIVFASGQKFVGVEAVLGLIADFLPDPGAPGKIEGSHPGTGKVVERPLSVDAPFSARVFKVVSESRVGELTFFRIYSGKIRPGDTVENSVTGETEKISALLSMRGKERRELAEACAGEIVATVKLKNTHIGDTLCAKDQPIVFPKIEYPKPVSFEAIEVEDKNVLEKVSTALSKIHEEDPTLVAEMNEETRQLVVYGLGELHLQVVKEKLAERYGVKIEWTRPRIPYKETILGTSQAQGKYKKQTGGRGQYGDVWLRLEPYEAEFNFVDNIVGGVVPSRFIPAVEKGIIETIKAGVLAGYPVTGVQVTLYDGSHHSVDSSELAFKIAASMGFKKAFMEANPILLEPIYKLRISTPEQFVGDVMGDLNSRRGRVQRTIPGKGKFQIIEALVPLAEVYKYINTLRSITQGLGSYEMEFDHYEQPPPQIAEAVIAQARKVAEEE